MNVLLISTNRAVHPMPVMPIGICMVADACSHAGHQVRVLDLMFEKDALTSVRNAVLAASPDAVGLSIRNIDNNDMRDPVFFLDDLPLLVNTIREMTGAPIVLGGAALGVMPEEILRHAGVSCGVVGDGEVLFPRLLRRIAEGEPFGDLPGIALIEQGRFRMTPCAGNGEAAACGAPEYHRWINPAGYRSQLATVPVRTKLGCPFRCVYCTYNRIEGSAWRRAEPAAVAEAVTRLVVSGARDIEFVDSVFNAPREHALGLCEVLARSEHRARYQSLELNPAAVDDDLLSSMERAGFGGIGITAESAADPVLQGLGKGFASREVRRAAEAVRRHRIPCAWIFLLGGPGETEGTVRETIAFARSVLRPQDVAFFNLGIRVYPGTELEAVARREGILGLAPREMLRPVFYVSPMVSTDGVRNEIRRSMAENLGFISADTLSLPFLPAINRAAYFLGTRQPLWQHARRIRRGLRMFGMDV